MHRRSFLALGGAVAAGLLLTGHSPYRQWLVYRQTHLIILTSRDDPGGDEFGEKAAKVLRTALPDSHARVARGPRTERIASLLSTRQADVAILSRTNAMAMYRGAQPFEQFGAIALRVIVEGNDHQLVCRDDFLLPHAYLVAEALLQDEVRGDWRVPVASAADDAIPPHAGALAFAEGRPLELRDRP
jgi:hypothetical protein